MNDREGEMFQRSLTKKKKTIRFALDDEILGESLPPQQRSIQQSVIIEPYKVFATDPHNPYADLGSQKNMNQS